MLNHPSVVVQMLNDTMELKGWARLHEPNDWSRVCCRDTENAGQHTCGWDALCSHVRYCVFCKSGRHDAAFDVAKPGVVAEILEGDGSTTWVRK